MSLSIFDSDFGGLHFGVDALFLILVARSPQLRPHSSCGQFEPDPASLFLFLGGQKKLEEKKE